MKILLTFVVIYVLFRILTSVKFKVVTFRSPGSFNDLGARRGYDKEPEYKADKGGNSRDSAKDAEDTVNCAACGAYLPVKTALTRTDHGIVRHFCTLPCSDEGKGTGNT